MGTPIRVRRTAGVVGVIAAASLVAACAATEPTRPADPAAPIASSTPPTAASPPATPRAPAAGPSSAAACRTSALRISLADDQAVGSAGGSYYPLNFTNVSTTPCLMYGYPGVSFAAAPNAAGVQIGAAAVRSATFPKQTVRLGAGSTAHAWLKVTIAANYPAEDCHPVTAQWVRVYPPAETVPGYLSHSFAACSSRATALLTILPVRPGQGVAGVTP
jgi:Protein of unknown function (DUF4232)